MKKAILFILFSFVFCAICFCQIVVRTYKIGTAKNMCFPVTGRKTVEKLFDGNADWSNSVNNWYSGSSTGPTFALPNRTIAALDSNYDDFKMRFAGGTGNSFFTIKLYSDSRTDSLVLSTQVIFNSWRWVDTATTKALAWNVRWVEIIFADFANVYELELYGTAISVASNIWPDPAASSTDPGIYFQGMGQLDDRPDSLDIGAASYRIGSSMDWWDTAMRSTQPDFALHEYVATRFADIKPRKLATLKARGWKSHIVSGGASFAAYPKSSWGDTISYLPISFGTYGLAGIYKDMATGADSTDHNSFINVERFNETFAKLWGTNTTGTLRATVRGTDTATKGQDQVWAQEIGGNEADKDWHGLTAYHSPEVKEAAVYAGSRGVQTGDPNMQRWSSAYTNMDTTMWKGEFIMSYLKRGRNGNLTTGKCFNMYISEVNRGRQPQSGADSGITPERYNVGLAGQRLNAFFDDYFPGQKKIWTEIGYATFEPSYYEVKTIAGQTLRETQAHWYLRLLEWASYGKIDGVYAYWQISDGTVPFGTMDHVQMIFAEGGAIIEFRKYEVAYWMEARLSAVKNYNGWNTALINGDSTGMSILKYTHLSNPDSLVVCLFYGTDNNSSTTNYDFSISGYNITGAELITPNYAVHYGTRSNLTPTAGHITIPLVSEKPVYVRMKIEAIGTPGPPLKMKGRWIIKSGSP